MARYGEAFRRRVVARMLPPESAELGALSKEVGVSVQTLENKGAWCREHGVFLAELEQWRASATAALAEPEEARASPQQTRADKKRIKELERELQRKDKALAEAAALLVLSKKVEAIFNRAEAA
jgi:transposase